MPVNGSLSISYSITETPLAGPSDVFTAPAQVANNIQFNFKNGTGLNQADKLYAARRTLNSAAAEDIDLSGVLVPLFGGGALALVRLKVVIVYNLPANTTNITVARGATNGVTLFTAVSSGLAALKPGCAFCWFDSSATALGVTLGTADLLNIANSAGAAAQYDIVIVGTSA
jgi:hypothetical protein